jgi:hypothetical protein
MAVTPCWLRSTGGRVRPACCPWHRPVFPLGSRGSAPPRAHATQGWRTQKNGPSARSGRTWVACNAPKRRCGRLSRAPEALGGRVEAARKGLHGVFVQPLSMVFQRATVAIPLLVSRKRLMTMSARCFPIDWFIWGEGRGPIKD